MYNEFPHTYLGNMSMSAYSAGHRQLVALSTSARTHLCVQPAAVICAHATGGACVSALCDKLNSFTHGIICNMHVTCTYECTHLHAHARTCFQSCNKLPVKSSSTTLYTSCDKRITSPSVLMLASFTTSNSRCPAVSRLPGSVQPYFVGDDI
jgi:hypothetical protein